MATSTSQPDRDGIRAEADISDGHGGLHAHADELSEPRLYFGWGKHLPMIRQSETAECALACLAMVAGYYGHHVDLPSLRRRFSLSLKGATVTLLVKMAETLGLACRPLRLDLDELSHLATPCILHWDLNHFVVLRKVKRRYVVIHDPAAGVRHLTIDNLRTHWTGIAIELSRGPDFKRKASSPPVSLRKLAGSIDGLGRALAVVFSLALLLELLSLLWPQFLQIVIDQVLADDDHNLLALLGFSFVLLLAIQTTISALRTWTMMWLGTHFNLSWAGNIFQHLMRLPQNYFLRRSHLVLCWLIVHYLRALLPSPWFYMPLRAFCIIAHTLSRTSARLPYRRNNRAYLWRLCAACRRFACTTRVQPILHVISTRLPMPSIHP